MENASHADTGTGERSEEHGPRGRRVRESEVIIMGVQRLSCRQRGLVKTLVRHRTQKEERRVHRLSCDWAAGQLTLKIFVDLFFWIT